MVDIASVTPASSPVNVPATNPTPIVAPTPTAPAAVGPSVSASTAPVSSPTSPSVSPLDPGIKDSAKVTPVSITSIGNPSATYSSQNIQAVNTDSASSLKDMKINKLEDTIAKANSTAEMNQIDIMNAPKAMNVLTGEGAHQSRLDTARINALTGMYDVKLKDLSRKEAADQKFIETYGADPNSRPKGMSRKDFSAALGQGKFSNLLTTDFKTKQADLQTKLHPVGASGTWSATTDSNGNQVLLNSKTGQVKPMGTATSQTGETLNPQGQAIQTNLQQTVGTDGKVDPQSYLEQRAAYVQQHGGNTTLSMMNAAKEFDTHFSGMLSEDGTNFIKARGGIFSTPAQAASSNPNVQNWVDAVISGNATMVQVPAALRNAVVAAMGDDTSPLAKSRMTMAASRITSPFTQMPAYQLTAGGQLYLGRIDAAMKTPGSVSDQDLLDSLTKLNTGGNAVTDAQVRLITDGKSFNDAMSVAYNKVHNGGVLSDKQRTQIREIASNIFDNYKAAYQPIYEQASSQLKAAGIPEQYWTIPNLNKLSGSQNNQSSPKQMMGPDNKSYYQHSDGLYYLTQE